MMGIARKIAGFATGVVVLVMTLSSQVIANDAEDHGHASAVFAGGCFWCMEPPYDELDGVLSTTSGFIGGHVESPSYEQVVGGGTGHVEAVQVVYDPAVIDYATLLEVFWRNVDPLDAGGQFCDRGSMYTKGIFVSTEQEQSLAEASKQALTDSGRFQQAIVTPIRQRTTFYPAEAYHQDYYLKNPIRYRFYRMNCGRDQRLQQLWGR